jgi:Na+/melibiose symporter-like transporter
VSAIRYGTGIIVSVIILIGIFLLFRFPIDHKKELEIQAAIEAKHGVPSAELS